MSTSTFRADQPDRRGEDEHRDEEGGDRVPLRVAGAGGEQSPTSTAVEPARSPAKWSALAANAGLWYAREARRETTPGSRR